MKNNIKLSEYFIMLGKAFEFITHESTTEVGLSGVYKDKNDSFQAYPFNIMTSKRGLCIATMNDSLKAFDKEYGTDYYNKVTTAIKIARDGKSMIDDIGWRNE